jgi:hypothetical protein
MSLVRSIAGLFKWRQFEPEVILLAVGWYLRFSLSYRDVEELLQERGICVDHVTLRRRVQRYAPEGSGANFLKRMLLSGEGLCGYQAARTAAQISGALAALPVIDLWLNCCFFIFAASSMPRIVTAAVSNRLNPSIGRTRCFILRWSCSITLFKYLQERTCTRSSSYDDPGW